MINSWKEYFLKIRSKIWLCQILMVINKMLLVQFTMKDEALMNEIISSFSKADINEELVRFKSHLDLVLKLINSKDLIGKKLDFYSQEMLREINTLSSKAMIADIKNEAVELKSHIEKMKEHAQNVE